MLNAQNFCSGVNNMLGPCSSLITVLKGTEYILKNTDNQQAQKVANYIKERRALIAICRLGALARLFQVMNLPEIADPNGVDLAAQTILRRLKPFVPFSIVIAGYIIPQINHLITTDDKEKKESVIKVSKETANWWECIQDWGCGIFGNSIATTWFAAMAYVNYRGNVQGLLTVNYNLIDCLKYGGELLGGVAVLMEKRTDDAEAASWWKTWGNRVKGVRVLAMVKPLHKSFFGA